MSADLQFDGIEKSFAGVPVLREVSFDVAAGHTLGLVGENGAGKSTLMNILGGNLRPDAGAMLLDGQPYAPRHPPDAAAAGIALHPPGAEPVPQPDHRGEPLPHGFPAGRPAVHPPPGAARAHAALLAKSASKSPPDTLVERLSAGERQLVEIAKALSLEPRLIILDEPTTSLTARETDHLLPCSAAAAARPDDDLHLARLERCVAPVRRDRGAARRGGGGPGPRAEFTADRMIPLMVGRSLSSFFPHAQASPPPQLLLEVARLPARASCATSPSRCAGARCWVSPA